jgi:hypothetical protein
MSYVPPVVVSPKDSRWILGSVAEEAITLSGLTTDSVANLLPADAIIMAVGWRITTTIAGTGLTGFTVGDPTTAARFQASIGTFTAGTTGIGLEHMTGAVATTAAGPTQAAAAKLRVTVAGAAVSAGVIRVAVHYQSGQAPTT